MDMVAKATAYCKLRFTLAATFQGSAQTDTCPNAEPRLCCCSAPQLCEGSRRQATPSYLQTLLAPSLVGASSGSARLMAGYGGGGGPYGLVGMMSTSGQQADPWVSANGLALQQEICLLA